MFIGQPRGRILDCSYLYDDCLPYTLICLPRVYPFFNKRSVTKAELSLRMAWLRATVGGHTIRPMHEVHSTRRLVIEGFVG